VRVAAQLYGTYAAGRDRNKALLAERDQLLAKLLQLQRAQAAEVSVASRSLGATHREVIH
jgi:hypothetical protein